MVGAELSAPSKPAESGGAWPAGVRVTRRSAWRQQTFPDDNGAAAAALETATHRRFLVVHFPRPEGGWTFAARGTGGGGVQKRARVEPQNKDGDMTIAKTARFVAAYAVETATGAAPPLEPVLAHARVLGETVYAVDTTTRLSRLDAAADEVPPGGAAPLLSARRGDVSPPLWETAPPPPTRTRREKTLDDMHKRRAAARDHLAQAAARIAAAEAAVVLAKAEADEAMRAHDEAQRELERTRVAMERARTDRSHKMSDHAAELYRQERARATVVITDERLGELEAGAALTALDDAPALSTSVLMRALAALPAADKTVADRVDEALLAWHSTNESYRTFSANPAPIDFSMLERSLDWLNSAAAPEALAWAKAVAAAPEPPSLAYVGLLVANRVLRHWFARGRTLEDLQKYRN